MDHQKMIEKIKRAAGRDKRNRKDVRFRRVLAFLVNKGFLKTNSDLGVGFVGKLRIKDALWAGKYVEPRILEVLPAAIARLPAAFIGMNEIPESLRQVVKSLASRLTEGPDFEGVPYAKLKVWMNLTLKDGRTRPEDQKRVTKTFRLSPSSIAKISFLKHKWGISETAIIEKLVEGVAPEEFRRE